MIEENDSNQRTKHMLSLASEIIASYVSKNSVRPADLPGIIADVHNTLTTLGCEKSEVQAEQQQAPAVSVRKSVTPDYIVCLEDGKKYKSLRRHLATAYGMTPDQYREKWKLPADYPMVAPAYVAARSALAKQIGLGANRRAAEPIAELAPAELPKARGRRKKESSQESAGNVVG